MTHTSLLSMTCFHDASVVQYSGLSIVVPQTPQMSKKSMTQNTIKLLGDKVFTELCS